MIVFAFAYGATLLVNLFHEATTADSLRSALPEAAALLGDVFVPAALALRFAFAAWLGWLIIYRTSTIAKWLVVLLVATKLLRVADAWTGLQTANVNSILWTISTVLALVAVACLFLPASRFWFATKGRTIKGDAAVFE